MIVMHSKMDQSGMGEIVAGPRFKIPFSWRYSHRGNVCRDCPMLAECRECCADGRVLACEGADELDAMGTRLNGGARGDGAFAVAA